MDQGRIIDLRSDQLTLCLVVPVFNEEDRVAESLDQLYEFISARAPGSRLLFVDDGSSDRTVEVVTSAIERWGSDVVAILCCPHAGKGAAVRSGLREAGTDLAAFCDIDLSTPLDQLNRIIAEAAAGNCLAIGSRAAPGARIAQHEERRREIAGKAFNRLVRAWLCPGVADTQCGAKAAPTEVWRCVLPFSREDGFAWDVEVIATALRLAIPVREVGIEWNHDERTRVRVWQDGVSMVLAVPRIGLNVWRATRKALPLMDMTNHPSDSRGGANPYPKRPDSMICQPDEPR
jgi:glycosyltransferase involved in cell wall biosynthesis